MAHIINHLIVSQVKRHPWPGAEAGSRGQSEVRPGPEAGLGRGQCQQRGHPGPRDPGSGG